MLVLPLSSIQISPTRQRRDLDDTKIQELAKSIADHGLFHAVVVRPLADGFRLVSGERRLLAIQNLRFLGKELHYNGLPVASDVIPCVTLGELDELSAEEAELDENIRRVDLSWQERAAATARLADLRARQAEASGAPTPTVATLAEEVRGSSEGFYQETTRREVITTRYLSDPDVNAAKSLDEAWKVLKRKEETRKNVELATLVGKTFTAALHEAHNAEALQWMISYTGEPFDVILTDPPYGMGADEFGDSGGMVQDGHHYKDSFQYWQQLMLEFSRLSMQITKPQAHLYIFCDFDRFHMLKGFLDFEGWDVHRTPLIWHNPSGMRLPWVDFGPQRKWQMILYAMRGRRPVTRIYPDLMTYASDENVGHAAQKPVALLVDLLKRSAVPGDRVLDPFAGSGTIFPAAHELKVKAVGVEVAEASYGLMLKRLEALKGEGA